MLAFEKNYWEAALNFFEFLFSYFCCSESKVIVRSVLVRCCISIYLQLFISDILRCIRWISRVFADRGSRHDHCVSRFIMLI